jgi:hypothetical protein
MPARIVPPRGLSYFDANLGRLVEEGPDVTDAKSRLREVDPDLDAYFDTVQGEWIVTWFDRKKNKDNFILSDKSLEVAYNKILKARNDAPGAETGDQLSDRLEREQEQLREKDMDAFREIAGDVGERLIHAFKKDGILDHENIYGPKPKKHLARRDVRIREPRSS